MHDCSDGKLKTDRKKAIADLKEKKDSLGNPVFEREEIDTSDLSDILTSRCRNEGDFVDQYKIHCNLEPAKFSESEWIEAKDIHLYYFPESDLAFLIILLVNQDLTIDNFYEFINPGYMLDYGTVEKLRANFLTEIECKLLNGILKELHYKIYILDAQSDVFRESYWLNVAFVETRFESLDTLQRLTYNAHRYIPIGTDFSDSSEHDIKYVSGARDVKQSDYGWGGCISSQSISYVYGQAPKIKQDDTKKTSEVFTYEKIWNRAENDLLLTIIALFQKYACIKINDMLYKEVKQGDHKEETIRAMKRKVLRVCAYETFTPSQISRWNNVCETYSFLLEINGVNEYLKDIQNKVNLLDEELDRVNAEREKEAADREREAAERERASAERENKIVNIIALFGAFSIIASVLTIIDFIKGSPIDMGIASAAVAAVVAGAVVKILFKEKRKK